MSTLSDYWLPNRPALPFFNTSILDVGIMFLGCPSVNLSHSCKRKISRTSWGNFFNFSKNSHLDSMVNWYDFGGQRSQWPHKAKFYLGNVIPLKHWWNPLAKTSTSTQGSIDLILAAKGNGQVTSKNLFCLVNVIFQEHLKGILSNLAHMFTWTHWLTNSISVVR